MSADNQSTPLLEAGDAAKRLGVSASGLRRLSGIYESVHGELPRKEKTNNRLWPTSALKKLETARSLVEGEHFKSISEALEALEQGYKPELITDELQSAQAGIGPLTGEVARRLLEELQAMRSELAEQRADNAALRHEIRQLAAPSETAQADKSTEAPTSTGMLVRMAARLERWLGRRQSDKA